MRNVIVLRNTKKRTLTTACHEWQRTISGCNETGKGNFRESKDAQLLYSVYSVLSFETMKLESGMIPMNLLTRSKTGETAQLRFMAKDMVHRGEK